MAGSTRMVPFSRRLCWRSFRQGGKCIGRRLGALGTLLSLLMLLTVSGPHLVHHTAELPLPVALHVHADQDHNHGHDQAAAPPPAPQRPPPDACAVLFFLQHTPGAISGCALPLALPAGAEPLPAPPPRRTSATPYSTVQARAPPRAFL